MGNQSLWQTAENSDASINALFFKKDKLTFCLCKWCLFTVLLLYID